MALTRAGIEPDDRHRLRPDIMIVEMSDSERARCDLESPRYPRLSPMVAREVEPNTIGTPGLRPRKIWVQEGGYTSDTRHLETVQDKERQHEQLLYGLQMTGYDARLMISTFGVGEALYQQASKDMHELGVDASACKTTLRAIHLHSIVTAAQIITQRRILDQKKFRNASDRPP